MNKVTVYAANAGSYNDYRVVAIFTTKAKAQAYMDAYPSNDWNDIEEYDLDVGSAELERGLLPYRVRMRKNGDVIEVERDDYPGTEFGGRVFWLSQLYGKPCDPWANFYAWAKDDRHAIKIANEKRIRSLADQ